MTRDVDYERAARLWSQYVGSQGTDEFMRWSRTDDIYEAVEDYIDNMPESGQDAEPEDLCYKLAAYIERDVQTSQRQRL